jgi:hypothetical protein
MLPDAFIFPFVLMIESVATFAVHQTLPLATVIDYDYPQLGVDLAITVPVAAGSTNFYLGGDYQFWAHIGQFATLNVNQSTVLTNGSCKVFIWVSIIRF